MPPSATSLPRWTWLPLPRPERPDPRAAERVARDWLGRQLDCDAESLPIHRDARGRPRLEGPFEGWDCNWSHSGDGLLVILGHGMQVGIDLECQRPRPRALELSRRFFADAETRWLEGLAPADLSRGFLRLWCAKEAVLKAHGHGLSFGLDRVMFADRGDGLRMLHCDEALGSPDQWQVCELAPASGYLGAMAVWLRPPITAG